MRRERWRWALALAAVLTVGSGCAAAGPARLPARTYVPAEEVRAAESRLFVYPTRDQTPARQDRDRYECYRWAVAQTSFDPSAPQVAPEHRLRLVPVPPRGVTTLQGTLVGAALGAGLGAVSGHAGPGAAIGAATGALVGASREYEREYALREFDARAQRARWHVEEQQLASYNRAMAACLEGRGYVVR